MLRPLFLLVDGRQTRRHRNKCQRLDERGCGAERKCLLDISVSTQPATSNGHCTRRILEEACYCASEQRSARLFRTTECLILLRRWAGGALLTDCRRPVQLLHGPGVSSRAEHACAVAPPLLRRITVVWSTVKVFDRAVGDGHLMDDTTSAPLLCQTLLQQTDSPFS